MFFRSKEQKDDFQQEKYLKKLLGRKASNSQLFVDFLRMTEGHSQNKTPNLLKNAYPLEERDAIHKDSMEDKLYSIYQQILPTFKKLEPYERAVLLLRLFWGFTIPEVSNLFGKKESWVFVQYNQALKTIQSILD
jgi:hypothetical protein